MLSDRALNFATIAIVLIAMGVGAHAIWDRTVQPRLDLRPIAIETDEWDKLLESGHRLGNADAPVQVVEFIDYQCAACRTFEQRLNAFRERFPDALSVTYLHWPLTRHPAAAPAARAIECAAEQDRFAELHRFLLSDDQWLSQPVEALEQAAEEFGFPDKDQFSACIRSTEPVPVIDNLSDWALSLGGRGTPTVIVNRQLLPTMPDSSALHQFLRDAGGLDLSDQDEPETSEEDGGSTAQGERRVVDIPTWTLSREPTLTVGMLEGPDEMLFHHIGGTAIMSDGRLAVVDAGAHVVRFYNDDGDHLLSLGREGEGPGDLSAPGLVEAVRYDSLVVANFGTFQRSIVGPGEEVRYAGRFDPRAWQLAALPNGVVEQERTMMGRRLERSGPRPGRDPVRLVDPSTDIALELGVFDYQEVFVEVLDSGRQRTVPVPFATGVHLAPLESGIVLNVGGGPELVRYDLSGAVRDTILLPLEPTEATDRHLDAWIKLRLATIRESSERHWRDVLGAMDVPEVLPIIDRLLPDGAGGFWARLHAELEELPDIEWIALNPEGELVGGITLPDRFELRQVGSDFVLGVSFDELGVQRVHRYDLVRSD